MHTCSFRYSHFFAIESTDKRTSLERRGSIKRRYNRRNERQNKLNYFINCGDKRRRRRRERWE